MICGENEMQTAMSAMIRGKNRKRTYVRRDLVTIKSEYRRPPWFDVSNYKAQGWKLKDNDARYDFR